ARELYNSRLAFRLMRSLAAAGEPGGAIQHARVHETLLRQDLNVSLGPEIASLVQQLQAKPPSQAFVAATSLSSSSNRPAESVLVQAWDGDSAGMPVRKNRHRSRMAIVVSLAALVSTAGSVVTLRMGAHEPAIPPIRSLAVLPLQALSGDSAQEYFAQGMHDALIGELARYPELTVISRTSVLHYDGTKKRLPEIARELNVQGVVEGTVFREGNRVRVNVQLLHGPSDRHLWARSYERDLGQILLLQDELANAIARELHVVTTPLKRNSAVSIRSDSVPGQLQVRELYLKGRHAEQTRSLAGLQTAKEAYRQAIERDSSFALGYAGLAGVYGLIGSYGFSASEPALDSARTLARLAFRLDSTSPEVRTALGVTLGDASDFAGAEREFRSAIRFSPSDARAHYWYAILLVALGRGEDALREVKRAAELDPFSPRGVTAMDRYARYLITGERSFLQIPAGKRWSSFLKAEPTEPWARRANAMDLAQAQKCPEARSELDGAQHLAPGTLSMEAGDAMVRWFCGDRPGAKKAIERLKRRDDARDQGIRIAMALALFGEKDSAFAWIGRTQWTLNKLTDLRANRWLDPLRSDPRYPELLRRLGLR
ncbi:MAG: tetratricopeptide repeat protein, partial [Gemmatimonadales bacterium]